MSDGAINTYNVQPRSLMRYLSHKGWTSEQRGRLRRFLFSDGTSDTIELIFGSLVPQKMEEKEIFLALETLASLYHTSIEAIGREINSILYDVIMSKIPDDYVRNDSIEVRVAEQYVQGMKSLLASSASTEISGDRHFKRTRKEAISYAETCRFGHTFRGSFGFTIESPVGLNDEPTIDGVAEDIPLGRRVIERLARGLKSCTEAVLEQNASIITRSIDGFNSNMCDALADLVEETAVSSISLSLKFSPEWRVSEDCAAQTMFKVQYSDIEVLRDAANSMRTDEKARSVTVYGRIRRLETEGNPADLFDDPAAREIEVAWVHEDNALLHVKVILTPQDYLVAVEAHRDGNPISATGLLVKSGRSWKLEQVNNFRVIHLPR